MEHSLELQKIHYFDEGNTYAGQKTKDPDSGLLLRYLVEPDKEAALLRAHNKLQKEVPLSEEGLEQALAWLEEQYAARKRKKGWETSRSHPFFLFLWAQSKIRPSVERVTTCQGRNFPLFFSAVMAACSKPPQQGTSMRTTVTL